MSITSDDIKNNGYIHPLADAAADEIEQLESRIAQLESELAEARKDQARYYWMQDWIEDRVKGTKEFFRAKTRSDFDTSIDAAIKEQGK